MFNRGICKFYARGRCLKGEQCDYSHQRNDTPVDICAYYQKGSCTYGSQCRFKHVKASQASSSADRRQSLVSDSAAAHTTRGTSSSVRKAANLSSYDKRARSLQHKHQESLGHGDVGESSTRTATATPSVHIFCPFAAADCPSRDKCPLIHGNQCSYCEKYCLHPTDREGKKNHLRTCEKKEKYLQDLSKEVECNVCLERVLSKPKQSECKFGLLPECDHAFCLSCIRNWRNSASASGMDINNNANTVRTCPVCRKLSYFVIPSAIWFSTKEEKQEIIDNYKGKCKSVDCKHFNFGNGNCPFGARCFYKHTVKQGSYTDIHRKPPPRHRPNNYDMYDVLDMLNEVDLQPEEYYSIMRDSEFFDEMDACEMMALSQSMGLYNSDEEDEYNFFQMAAFSEAMASGVDDFGPEDFENEEFNPMEAALFSMMMHSNMEEEEEDDDDDDDDDDDESDEHFF